MNFIGIVLTVVVYFFCANKNHSLKIAFNKIKHWAPGTSLYVHDRYG